MKVLVVGGGKVGFFLSKTLLEHGHEPTIIEKSKPHCQHLANELDIPIICGDGTVVSILENADVKHADAMVCVTGKDEVNLIACQLAKRFYGVRRTVARVNNPKNLGVMKQLGVDIPICPTNNMARLLEMEIETTAIKQLLNLNRGLTSLCEMQLPDHWRYDNARLMEIPLPDEVVIVSVIRDGEFIIPRGNTVIRGGDKLMAICQNDKIHDLTRIFELS